MLDPTLKEQLKDVFSKLTGTVTLRLAASTHAEQEELFAMLNDVASMSDKIRVEQTSGHSLRRTLF